MRPELRTGSLVDGVAIRDALRGRGRPRGPPPRNAVCDASQRVDHPVEGIDSRLKGVGGGRQRVDGRLQPTQDLSGLGELFERPILSQQLVDDAVLCEHPLDNAVLGEHPLYRSVFREQPICEPIGRQDPL